ncbi:aspartyl-phosphate phosphatase Spo0E family protein [Virgibacillus halodenitrificans]|uniref:aspartyl-phosphate phosphatase Spo0E family protein n=2 Tax=Virgibacillus halodenitrificans TaxID=1482 RepID=UPI000EF53774|nr:aspartyl-phosphate phosphatase Spo0E family protein [Virgibacillus halodenitrificans]
MMIFTYKEETKTDYILDLIEHKRKLLLKATDRFGINSQNTLQASQELDELIIKYQRMMQSEEKESV